MDEPLSNSYPALLVWSSLFPSAKQPQAGIFIRERMFRVGEQLPVTVISPQPWFPLQGIIRRFRPHFRPATPAFEIQRGIEVYRPRYFSFPGVLKHLDGLMMAKAAMRTVSRLKADGRVDVIDAHFGYPDGYAASRVAKALGLPYTVTMRGTEQRHSNSPRLRPYLREALQNASRIIAVSTSLKRLALKIGIPSEQVVVVGNGVDSRRFSPMDRSEARAEFELPASAPILITVGGLVERKGFHRVIACLPELRAEYPDVHYLAVGSAGPEGDFSSALKRQVDELGMRDRVHFLGALPPERVRVALAAADVFVLATSNEGWANVLLESMACGVPVVATDVGGNSEVVCSPEVGTVVPFGDEASLRDALREALQKNWDRSAIREYAVNNDWGSRVPLLIHEFSRIAEAHRALSSIVPDGASCRE